jgi:hypothetical protein
MASPVGLFGSKSGNVSFIHAARRSKTDRRAPRSPQLEMSFGAEDVRVGRVAFDHEEIEDDVEAPTRLWRGRQRVEDVAARMRPTSGAFATLDVVVRVPVDRQGSAGAAENRVARRVKDEGLRCDDRLDRWRCR